MKRLLIVAYMLVHIHAQTLGLQHMFTEKNVTFPRCPRVSDHTKVSFEWGDPSRDPAGIPCVLHLTNGNTIAHALDSHGHFMRESLVETFECKRKYVGHKFTDWQCEMYPPPATALNVHYRVMCVDEDHDGAIHDMDAYFTERYEYADKLYNDALSITQINEKINGFIGMIHATILGDPQDIPHYNAISAHQQQIADSWGQDHALNPAYVWNYVKGPTGKYDTADNPQLERELPTTYCSITYSAKANHSFLILIAASRIWIALPVTTVILAMILLIIVAPGLNRHPITEVHQGMVYRTHYPQPDFCGQTIPMAFQMAVATVIYITLNLFIYYVVSLSLDLYSHTPIGKANAIIVGQYFAWSMISLIYLWSIPTTRKVYIHMSEAVRKKRKARHSPNDPAYNHRVKESQRKEIDSIPLSQQFSSAYGAGQDVETGDPVLDDIERTAALVEITPTEDMNVESLEKAIKEELQQSATVKCYDDDPHKLS